MNPGNKTIEQLKDKAREFLWHPFTQMQEYVEEEPVIIDRAEGITLIDIEGQRYIDGVSSLWVNVHGHRKPEIDEAIKAQVDRVSHSTLLGLSNVPAVELAERLINLAPASLKKVFYSDSGSTAVEIALKMAFQYFQHIEGKESNRTRFMALTHSYHGDTLGSVSVGGISLFHEIFRPLLFSCSFAPAPYCYRCPLELEFPSCRLACADALEEQVEKEKAEIAALIIEPLVQGAAGILTAPTGYLKRVREICNRFNILMIADEVATGFGRTGTMFACEQEDVTPDLLCLAKGITGGTLPLAATLTSQAVFDAFLGTYAEFKTFFHGHTYTGNPLACAAALANLAVFEKEKVLEKLQGKITLLTKELDKLEGCNHVGEIRQRGFMVGIEIVKDRTDKTPYPAAEKIGHRIILAARKRGLIIRPLGNIIVLMPPLCTTLDEIIEIVAITKAAIREVTEP